ncbi:uncharacterized protein HKW66_Vig0174200 [Vigna angularis]|uniref:5'-deoxynucleotidase n=1 Tax=Phaseolus angularis TaxID=3914 RepID=A0A8T0JNN2_PHAAN|nr:uncharacterized protein HKW66_Vig0174200 [Vigna angularis]
MAIHYSPTPRCCVPALHRTSPSRSVLTPSVFFPTPTLRLFSVRSQASGSDAVGSAKKHSHAAVGLSSSSSVIDFLTLCHRLKVCGCHFPFLFSVNAVLYGGMNTFKLPLVLEMVKASKCFLFVLVKETHASVDEIATKVYSTAFIILTTKRKGWVNHGIKGAESIADHMYRMALMALIAGDVPGLNRERCIKIALVHDIAEGDITPSDGVPKAEKSRREQEALNKMCELLGGGMRAEEIKELWEEYENNSSLEANLVKDFDKVELILQALEYEVEHGKVLDEFFLSTAGKFQTEIGKSWAAEIMSRRKSISAKRGKLM